jgi:DNA-binding FadR family transcriptional regulator
MIALGRCAPGERLPSERAMAELLGVSRMTIRSAVRELNAEGIVHTTRGRFGGTTVSERPQPTARRRSLRNRAAKELRENYDFRMTVEPRAAEFCALRATARQREKIMRLAAREARTLAEYRTLDSRFHVEIAENCRNRHLAVAIENARSSFFQWADALWMLSESFSPATEDSTNRHRRIAAAIMDEDGESAAIEMIRHLDASASAFLARLGND